MKQPIIIYTDGACNNSVGEGGIGVLIKHGTYRRQISKYLGGGHTSNTSELLAIKEGLLQVGDKSIMITIYSDSQYCIGVLSRNWKAKKNIALINDIKELISSFAYINFVHVKGHSGEEGNELVDELAVAARKSKLSFCKESHCSL